MITTTPISPTNIVLKGSPSPTSSNSGTGGKKTSRPPKGSKQFSSPLASPNNSSSSSSMPPMTPNDQLPQQNLPSFKGPVIHPTHFPYFPMNPMAVPNPMMFAPMNPIHMIPTTTPPPIFAMFPQPLIPNIPPPQTPMNNLTKVPPPIQPKPSTSPPPSNNQTVSQATKPKPKKKKKTPNNTSTTNNPSNTNNSCVPIAASSSTSNNSKTTTPKQTLKRKPVPSTSLSIHEHIISYLCELGLKDSAKILENDLKNPLLLNASQDSISSFVHNLSNEIERHSNVTHPPNKRVSTNEITNSSTEFKTNEELILQQQQHDTVMKESSTENTNGNTTNKYEPENYLNILRQTTKSESSFKPTAEYVNERLENLEKTLGIQEQKVEVFSRIKNVEEKLLEEKMHNLDVNHNVVNEPNEDDFFKNFFENNQELELPNIDETTENTDIFIYGYSNK